MIASAFCRYRNIGRPPQLRQVLQARALQYIENPARLNGDLDAIGPVECRGHSRIKNSKENSYVWKQIRCGDGGGCAELDSWFRAGGERGVQERRGRASVRKLRQEHNSGWHSTKRHQ